MENREFSTSLSFQFSNYFSELESYECSLERWNPSDIKRLELFEQNEEAKKCYEESNEYERHQSRYIEDLLWSFSNS